MGPRLGRIHVPDRLPTTRLRFAYGALAVALPLLLAGCPNNGVAVSTNPDGSGEHDFAPMCTGMNCIPGCQCMTGLVCDTTSKTCVQCVADTDCPSGQLCDLTRKLCA